MATPVEAPKLGNTVEEVQVTRWAKRKGDPVAAGELVVEIETDKANFEVTSPVDGTLLETFFEEGTLVPVFTNLFVIGAPGENVDAFRPQSAGSAVQTFDSPPVPPVAQVPVAQVPGLRSATATSFSPRARRFAEEHDFHPSPIAGSGPGGRVLEQDLRQAYDSSAARISSVREKIARRMRESLASTAQYTLNASADAGRLLAARATIKASNGAPDININDLVSFCAVHALLEMPDLNVEFIDGRIHKHSAVHLGFAIDTPRGLLVAVVRDAHALTVAGLALKMKELTSQAIAGTISANDLSGATFTVSNLGGLGIESFTPLLNPPQVAILGVGAIQVKPVRRQGKIEFIDAIGLSLTCDHQVIDGAPGARFLQVLKEKVENVECPSQSS
jgi:pyruvate dehydrogenase E2 component (dihydrolipoamide acetyltransferase)